MTGARLTLLVILMLAMGGTALTDIEYLERRVWVGGLVFGVW